MKLSAVLKAITPFLATDKKPDEVIAAIIAADKKAKDEFPEKDKAAKDKAAKDRKAAHDKARDKMDDEDKKAFDAMSEEEKDKVAKDAETDPEHTNDEELEAEDDEMAPTESGTPSKGGASKKPALDSATVNKMIQAAVAKRDELHAATAEVEPIVGKRAFDDAGAAYKTALDAMHVDLTGIPESAYRAVFNLAKRSAAAAPTVAMDSASNDEVRKLIPHYGRL